MGDTGVRSMLLAILELLDFLDEADRLETLLCDNLSYLSNIPLIPCLIL